MRSDTSLPLLARHLRRARLILFAAGWLRGMLRWAGLNLLLWAALVTADILLTLPMEFRLPLLLGGAGITGYTLLRAWLRPLLAIRNLDRTALVLEQRFGISRNLLINAFQLSRQPLSSDEDILARQTIRGGLGRCAGLTSHDLWQLPALVKPAAVALAVGAAWLVAAFLFPADIRLSLQRLSRPLADVPPAGTVVLTVIPDRDVTVFEGDAHEIRLRVEPRGRGRGRAPVDDRPPRIVLSDSLHVGVAQGAREPGQLMLPLGTDDAAVGALYTYRLADMRRSRSFRIFHDAGGTYTRSYQVRVQRSPDIVESEFRLTPPAYTGLATSGLPGPPRAVMGLPGSRLTVDIRLDRPVDNLFWKSGDRGVPFAGDDGMRWIAETAIHDAGTYTVFTLPDGQDRRLPIAAGSLLVDRDTPPHVAFATDRLNREAWPGETVDFEIVARDDYGISAVTLSVVPAHGGANAARKLAAWQFDGPPGERQPDPSHFSLTLNPGDFAPGNDYLFQARASDFHPQPQSTTSRPMLIRVRGMADVPDAISVSGALDALQQAIAWQRRALSDTRTVATYMDAILGHDPERPAFTFHHHRESMETRQQRVDDLLGIVRERAPDPTRELVLAVEAVRREAVRPLVADIARLAGDPDPWFSDAGSATLEADGSVARFAPRPVRYVGIAFPGDRPPVEVGSLAFMDGDDAYPAPHVDRYKFAPIFHPWDGPVGFVENDEAALRRITEAALEQPLRGGRGPLLNWEGRIEGAPARHVALYGVRRIRTQQHREVVMWTGSSDTLRVWINGERVVNRLARRAPSPDQERTVLDLAPGEHHLLVEVSVADRAPVLALRFTEPDGTALGLHDDGRLERALAPRVVFAGGSPADAGLALDGNRRTAWRVSGERPRVFICDLNEPRTLSGLALQAPAGRDDGAFGAYRLFLADALRIDDALPPVIDDIAARQSAILDRLAAIRAAWLDDDYEGTPVETAEPPAPADDAVPAVAVAGDWLELVAELLDTADDAIDLAAQRRSVLDRFGDDFSDEALARLQDIKDSEKRLARYLRDIVQDMSALGDLDLPEATQVANLQELVELADRLAEVAAEKADLPITQIADSLDTAELELHEELRKQSEVAFGDTSRIQDIQELGEDMKTPLPMAELPQTLSDLVGEMEEGLLEFEDEAQTVGSMLKSLDADGPIGPGRMSSTSAEGKTGDEPPDAAQELEGRSGFGRTGRASGEGVTDVAEDLPQDSAAAPARDTGTSLEAGMVEDRSTQAVAESTGLGKETDDTERFGMSGTRLPPGLLDRMRETARRQDDLRETLGEMILELRRHNLPSVRLSRAARTMEGIAHAAEDGDAQGFRYAYRDTLDHLVAAEADIGHHIGMRYLRDQRETATGDARAAVRADVPEAYRHIVSEYFKALAEEGE